MRGEKAVSHKETYPDATADQSHSALWMLFLFVIIFLCAGLWILLDAANTYDMLMGGTSTFLCIAVSLVLANKLKPRRF